MQMNNKNLFTITNNLQEIFDRIEENEGELTPELEEELAIKQEELDNKLKSYQNAINQWKSDIDACKNEIKRIQDIKKAKENRIDRLKNVVLFAIDKFGYDGKSGNKVYELPDAKFYTRNSEVYKINEDRIKFLIHYSINLLQEFIANGMFDATKENLGIDIEGFIDTLNNIIKAEYELGGDPYNNAIGDISCLGDKDGKYIPFTVTDLMAKIEFKRECKLTDALFDTKGIIKVAEQNDINNYCVNNITSSQDVKLFIDNLSIATKENKKSIIIK